jgi:uncharacterized cupin superfamily protein
MGDVMSIGLLFSNECAQKCFTGFIHLIEAMGLNRFSVFRHKVSPGSSLDHPA